MDTTSYWTKTSSLPRFRKLDADLKVDVVVVGAGITGVTAAYLIKKAGYTVALLDRRRCGGFDTTNTTAHLTCVTDSRLHDLVATFGREKAKAVWDSGRAAIDQIFNNIRMEEVKCDFAWVPAYLHSARQVTTEKEKTSLKNDARLANEFGFPAQFMDSVPLVGRCGVKFLHQAKFNPLKYLAALLRTIPGKGSHIFEHSEVEEVQPKPLLVKAGKYRVRCSYIVLATHNPIMGKTALASATLFQTKLFLYTSYAIGAKIPAGSVPEASFWDTAEPYNYLRIDRYRNFDYAILGGEDHKTGQIGKPEQAYQRLEKRLKKWIPNARVDSHWSGQVIETSDGLPYIGETAESQFAATGFGGNGMTFGTLGAMMALDAFRKLENPGQELFDLHRKNISGTWRYMRENRDYPYYLLRDRFRSGTKSQKSVPRNEGGLLILTAKKSLHIGTNTENFHFVRPFALTWDALSDGMERRRRGIVPATVPALPPAEKCSQAPLRSLWKKWILKGNSIRWFEQRFHRLHMNSCRERFLCRVRPKIIGFHQVRPDKSGRKSPIPAFPRMVEIDVTTDGARENQEMFQRRS